MAVQRRPKTGTDKNGKVSWIVRYRDGNGKEHSKSFSKEREAKQYDAHIAEKLRTNSWIDPSVEKKTVLQVFDEWCKRDMRPNTRRNMEQTRKQIENHPIGGIRIGKVTQTHADEWFNVLISGRPWMDGKPLSRSTARTHFNKLSATLYYAFDCGYIVKNPLKVPKEKKKTSAVKKSDIPSRAQLDKILDAVENGGGRYLRSSEKRMATFAGSKVLADMCRVAIGTGLRVGEISALTPYDIDLEKRLVHVQFQVSSNGLERVPLKTDHSMRTVPLPTDVLDVVKSYIDECSTKHTVLFRSSRDRAFSTTTATIAFRHATAELGYGFTFHSFRHYYASKLISMGVSIPVVQRLLGHSKASITLDTYTHVIEDSWKELLSDIDKVLG